MVERGHIVHQEMHQRVLDVIAWFQFDARSDRLKVFAKNFNTVERDFFGVPESSIALPEVH